MRMQGQLLPELSEIAVLGTKNAVLHPLSVLALQVAETASKEVVFVVQAVATTLDVSRHEFCLTKLIARFPQIFYRRTCPLPALSTPNSFTRSA